MFWYVQPIGHQLLIGEGPTYGYRRITALANRELGRTGEPVINHKRMFRIMRQNGCCSPATPAAGTVASTTARWSSWARTCAGVQTGLRLPAGTGTS